MAVLNTGLAKTSAEAYTIDYSCRFEDGSSAYLSRAQEVGDPKTWTWSGWVKRGNLGISQNLFGIIFSGGSNYALNLKINSDDTIGMDAWPPQLVSTEKFRDTSAWYHIVWTFDTTQSTEADRVKIYVNGSQIALTELGNANWYGYPPEDHASAGINSLDGYTITMSSVNPYGSSGYLDGYLAEVHFVDGTALTPTSFGESGDYGEWKPIEVTGVTYGTNGFYLDFADSADLGNDVSGEGNDWTANNLDAADQMLDTPTNNFATWNPLHSKDNVVFAEGNLSAQIYHTGESIATSTINPSTGKWYFEVVPVASSGDDQMLVGLSSTINFSLDSYSGSSAGNSWGMYSDTNQNYFEGSTSGNLGDGSGYDVDDIIQVAYDMDAGKMWYGKNNTWLGYAGTGNPATGAYPSRSSLTGSIGPSCSTGSSGHTFILNAGQDSSFAGNKTAQGNQDGNGIGDFYYTPPTDFLALCTSNLPDATVTPSEHFNTVLYTGNGSTQSITGVGFQPDLTWIKKRSSSESHYLYDAVRGATKELYSDGTWAEETAADSLTAFDADGFSVGTYNALNENTETLVAWNWKANGSGSANTVGDIDSTVSVNTDAGFSIVSYTGNGTVNQTVGHGLSKVPELIIIKARENTGTPYWSVINPRKVDTSDTNILYLNNSNAEADDTNIMGDNLPTATTFGVDDYEGVNVDTLGFIAYCWHSVDGYSKFGTYTGNGDADGTFVYLGFRPAFVLIKKTGGETWQLHDSARPDDNVLRPEGNGAELVSDGTYIIDFNANGFKLRGTSGAENEDTGIYTYYAFAETPFKYSNGQ